MEKKKKKKKLDFASSSRKHRRSPQKKKNESFSDDMHSKLHSLNWGYDLPISRPRRRTTGHEVSVVEMPLMAF
jgi:hypothetical protein